MDNESSGTDEAAATDAKSNREQKPARHYLPGAQRRHQPKSTDWIPKRRSSVAIFMTALFAVTAAIVGATWLVPSAGESAMASGIRERFSVHGASSLSIWFSTVLLLVSGLASLQIHALRQHRSNDYRGTYRIWLLISGLLILASVNCVVDFGGLFYDFIGPVRNGSTHWTAILLPAAQIIALGVIFVRGMVEVRKSPASLAVISLVWLGYVVSIVLRIPGIESRVVQDDGISAASLNLFSTTGILAAITVYARHVYLRANGLVSVIAESVKPKRNSKPARKITAAKNADSTDQLKTVTKTKTRKTALPKPAVKTAQNEVDETVEPPKFQPAPVTRDRFAKIGDFEEKPDFSEANIDDDEPEVRRLSKTERKRLKKLQRSQHDRRAA